MSVNDDGKMGPGAAPGGAGSRAIERHRGVAISRRGVFAGLAMAPLAVIAGLGLARPEEALAWHSPANPLSGDAYIAYVIEVGSSGLLGSASSHYGFYGVAPDKGHNGVAYCAQCYCPSPYPGQGLSGWGTMDIPMLDYVLYRGYDGDRVKSILGCDENVTRMGTQVAVWYAIGDNYNWKGVLGNGNLTWNTFYNDCRWDVRAVADDLLNRARAYASAPYSPIMHCNRLWLNHNHKGSATYQSLVSCRKAFVAISFKLIMPDGSVVDLKPTGAGDAPGRKITVDADESLGFDGSYNSGVFSYPLKHARYLANGLAVDAFRMCQWEPGAGDRGKYYNDSFKNTRCWDLWHNNLGTDDIVFYAKVVGTRPKLVSYSAAMAASAQDGGTSPVTQGLFRIVLDTEGAAGGDCFTLDQIIGTREIRLVKGSPTGGARLWALRSADGGASWELAATTGASRRLDIPSGNVAQGDSTTLQAWQDNGSPAQRWTLRDNGDGTYAIFSALQPRAAVYIPAAARANAAAGQPAYLHLAYPWGDTGKVSDRAARWRLIPVGARAFDAAKVPLDMSRDAAGDPCEIEVFTDDSMKGKVGSFRPDAAGNALFEGSGGEGVMGNLLNPFRTYYAVERNAPRGHVRCPWQMWFIPAPDDVNGTATVLMPHSPIGEGDVRVHLRLQVLESRRSGDSWLRVDPPRVEKLADGEVALGSSVPLTHPLFGEARGRFKGIAGMAFPTPEAGYWHPGDTAEGDWKSPYVPSALWDETWVWTRAAAVHFMVVDQDGDPVEILTKLAVVGSEIGWGEGSELDGELRGAFGAARPEWGREGEEVWGHTAKWYPGDSFDGDWDGKKVEKATVKGETWVWAAIRTGNIEFYRDSVRPAVYTVLKAIAGTYFTIPDAARAAAVRPACNLDASFGSGASTGFTGWFTDPELTEAAPERWMVEARLYRVFARNRLSTRYAYADGSALPEPGAVYRRAPRETAEAVPAAMGLPDFSGDERQHLLGKPAEASGFGGERARSARAREALGEVELPPTGDCGPAHETLYLGEHVSLGTPARVYREMGDGRWRSYRCLGWFRDPAATLSAIGSTTPERDCAYYVKWEESTVDGVVARGGVGE